MTHAARFATLCLLALGLAACGDKAATDKNAAAGGQVLPGSTSDAMLPHDTVSSQPPLASPKGEGGADNGDSSSDESADPKSGAKQDSAAE